ncbi:MAG: Na+/H+ antiporter NhaC family protein [Akkermansia sp.]
MKELPVRSHVRGLYTLSPLFVFFLLYVLVSVAAGDFYKMPVTVAFLAASVWACCISRPKRLAGRLERFSLGAAHRNIMLMVWIFILAGAFAAAAKSIGAVEAMVNLTLWVLPPQMLPAGIFLAACLISLSIGTSVGTIVALMPLAAGMAERAGLALPLMAGVVVGGAFFGDNLSFISDTTVAATRTQGCRMQDKFFANVRMVLPAALLVMGYYALLGQQVQAVAEPAAVQWVRVLPYLLVLGAAVAGVDVTVVLVMGIAATGLLAAAAPELSTTDWLGAMGQGIGGMGELIMVTLLAGGMLELIRYNGGLSYIIRLLTARVRGRRGAELCLALLAALANVCTANNTVAIVTVGPLAQRIARRYGIPAPRSAGLLDTSSCVVQGLLPYGAQLLMGSALAGISTLQVIPYLYYPVVMGVLVLGNIALSRRC